MTTLLGRVFVVVAALSMMAPKASAQTVSTEPEKGFTEVESFQGELNSLEKTMKLDSNIGYDFNKHFGAFIGVPIYFTNISSTTTATGTTTNSQTVNGIGNLYLGFALRAPNPTLNYVSTVTLGAPTGDTKKGLSTGRGTVDWLNHFDRSFDRFTPYFDAGFGNTVPDTKLLTRSFISLGGASHLEEGAEFQLVHHFSVGGAGYEVFPFGNQKVFSKVSAKGSGTGAPAPATTAGKRNHGVFQTQFQTSGTGLTRENGVNTWLALESSSHLWRAEIGFSRSVTFDFNSFAFNLGLNVGKILRSKNSN
ncbi:MAG TPA: hypothetical protein VNW97_12665 [Candidatus Saccharimonadales bacterium]|jgi:hypothetical protein|nr:hypothetical protein [Candidatus Saccharimonadales bacterium]